MNVSKEQEEYKIGTIMLLISGLLMLVWGIVYLCTGIIVGGLTTIVMSIMILVVGWMSCRVWLALKQRDESLLTDYEREWFMKLKIDDKTKEVTHILQHGNRFQKILVVCNPFGILEIIWISQGIRGFLSKGTYEFLWALVRYDYWDKAKLIWTRKVLA
jgi:hypothetical protein